MEDLKNFVLLIDVFDWITPETKPSKSIASVYPINVKKLTKQPKQPKKSKKHLVKIANQ